MPPVPQALTSHRLLGRSGLRVSPLCLGTMTFGTDWAIGADKDQSRRVLDLYLDGGGNFLDTANYYTGGTSESWIGEFLEGKREQIVIATKYTLHTRESDDASSREESSVGSKPLCAGASRMPGRSVASLASSVGRRSACGRGR